MMEDIRVTGLVKRFGGKTVFGGLNMTFAAGGITALTGASGSGKTTLLSVMMRLIKPDGGAIEGVPQRMSAVFQEDRLIEHLSALRNAAMGCLRLPARDIVMRHLRAVGLEDAADIPASRLSGGMRQRAAIVRACIAPSDIIFMDEPFSALDTAAAERVIRYILEVRNGRTVIVSLHNAEHARLLGAEVVSI